MALLPQVWPKSPPSLPELAKSWRMSPRELAFLVRKYNERHPEAPLCFE